MGKHKKNFNKRWDKYYKKKKHKQKLTYESRAEMLLSRYDDALLYLWFGDDEDARLEFGRWLVDQETFYEDDESLDILMNNDSDDNRYYKKIRKIRCDEPAEDMEDVFDKLYDLIETEKKYKKGKKLKGKYRDRDLGIATYMNSSRYRKSYLNKDAYRKYLRQIAKEERREEKEMIRLGYIRSIDPDDELKKLIEANNRMSEALSDSYIQKHFIS